MRSFFRQPGTASPRAALRHSAFAALTVAILGFTAFAVERVAAQPAPAAAPAPADVVTIKMGSLAPQGTPWETLLTRVRKRIEKASGGKLKIKPYLGGVLGSENSMVEATKAGTSQQMFGGSTSAVAALVPELDLFELPYLFRDLKEADYVMDKVVRDDMAALLAKRGLILLGWSENGYRNFGTKNAFITDPSKLKGLKMRAQESLVHIEMYKAFGASPVPIAATEVLSSLQTGVVDGFDNTPLFSFAASWYTAIKYYTVTEHIYQPAAIILNKSFYDGLSPELQKAITDAPEDETDWGRKAVRALTDELLKNFERAGIQVKSLTPAEKAEFAKLVKPVYDKYRKVSPEADRLLTKTEKALAEFRAKK